MKIGIQGILVAIFGCFNIFYGLAQKNIIRQDVLWTSYALKLKINDNYQIRQELDQRNYSNPWRQHQMLSRTNLEYQLGNGWTTAVGVTGIVQSLPNDPEVKEYYTQKEIRPQIELAYKQTVSEKFTVNHRFWSEFRFFELEHDAYAYANVRLRYKIEIKYTPLKKVSIKAFDELFINAGNTIVNNVFDQNRIGSSIQYMPINHLGFEIGYFNMFQQQKSGIDFYSRDIIKFTIHHTILVKKNKV
ncbi:DUF2490 domain-containing protein [Cellulophaga sp. L1A9]|uniref:DUF2490 domain-containing protein n=1 Tax=Cellulophaga sp. L1A9 TaxID=2686362 RepID=UPI00131E414E|nr:DUF2490 domain-containing protein [Cellulophaga sp. L1A9]